MGDQSEYVDPHTGDSSNPNDGTVHDHAGKLTLEEALDRLENRLRLDRVQSVRVRRGLEGAVLGGVLGLVFAVVMKFVGHEGGPHTWGQVLLVPLGFAAFTGIIAALDGPGVRHR